LSGKNWPTTSICILVFPVSNRLFLPMPPENRGGSGLSTTNKAELSGLRALFPVVLAGYAGKKRGDSGKKLLNQAGAACRIIVNGKIPSRYKEFEFLETDTGG
jgi:hypothetical protein